MIYLDNNATTPLDPEVIEVMNHIFLQEPLNPSSPHSMGRKARAYLEKARQDIADFLKVDCKEIIFTSSGTEALNLLIRGIVEDGTKGHVLSSNLEHSAIAKTLEGLEDKGFSVNYLKPSDKGIEPNNVKGAIRRDTKLVVLSWVNGETGEKTDIPTIAKICEEKNVPLVVDGVALMGKELFSIPNGVSGMAFSGHKFHGPKGVGFAYIKKNLKIHPQITGGQQEYQLRAGTENLASIVGLAKAITLLEKKLPEATEKMRELRDYFEERLKEFCSIIVNSNGPRVCNVSNLYLEGIEAESLLFYLDQQGVMTSHGSACASLLLEPSRVLKNMGYSKERVLCSLRFSLSRNTSKEELERAVEIIGIFSKKMCV